MRPNANNTSTEIGTGLAALEEGLLDLGILLRRQFAHDMIEKIDRVNAISRPRSGARKPGSEVVEVNLASASDTQGMNVLLISLGRARLLAGFDGVLGLFSIEINLDAGLRTLKLLGAPVRQSVTCKKLEGIGMEHTKQACYHHRSKGSGARRGPS